MRRGFRLAERWIRLSAWVVPADRRAEWREEWLAELRALESADVRRPGPLEFARGSLRHGVWMRMEGWTMDGLVQDVRLAWRVLSKRPGFALVSVLVLALGIGANTAIFSLLNGLLLRHPAGVERPGELVQLGQRDEGGEGIGGFSWLNTEVLRDASPALLDGVEGFSEHQFQVEAGQGSQWVIGHFVTGGWFDLLRVRPAAGRLLGPEDDRRIGGHPVAVLSWSLWQDAFGGSSDVVGQSLRVGGAPYTVVGVAPRGFTGVHTNATPPQLFVPAVMNPGWDGSLPFDSWKWSWLNLVGRRADGVSDAAVREAAGSWTEVLRAAHPDNAERIVHVEAAVGLQPWAAAGTRRLGAILAGVVLLVLLLTCVSTANLFVSRVAARDTEFGVRRTLGAGRGRIVRQVLVEAGLIAAAAVTLALPVAFLADDLLPAVVPLRLEVALGPDLRVFGFLAGAGVLVTVLCGAAPAWVVTRPRPSGSLGEVSPTRGPGRVRLRDGLVALQLALSLSLLAGGGLLARSLIAGRQADPGFESRGRIGAILDLQGVEAGGPLHQALFPRLVAGLESRPGVRQAAVSSQLPIAGGQNMGSIWREEGVGELEVENVAVGPGWFAALQVPLVQGREPGADPGAPEVVLSESLARRLFPSRPALGETIWAGQDFRVVGVAADVQMRSLRAEPNPAVYFPMDQAWPGRVAVTVVVNDGVSVSPAEVVAWAREIEPAVNGGGVDLRAAVLGALEDVRAIGLLVAGFSGLALILSIVGLWGLVAEHALARRREFGIRIALGARTGDLQRMVTGQALRIVAVGLIVGVPLAVLGGQALQSVLFGVTPSDPVAIGLAGLLLAGVTVVAAWLPARRAGAADPLDSLRE